MSTHPTEKPDRINPQSPPESPPRPNTPPPEKPDEIEPEEPVRQPLQHPEEVPSREL